MKTINLDQLLIFHEKIIKETGGSSGVRDNSLLESALNKPFTTFEGHDLYDGLIRKISAITFSLIKNHGFVDGNKRIGVATMLLLTRLNNISLRYDQSELVALGLNTAAGNYTEEDIEHWILEHQVK